MPSVDPTATGQLGNLPGRHTVTKLHIIYQSAHDRRCHSIQIPVNPPMNTFQYISGPSELSFTTSHSRTIFTPIRTIIYTIYHFCIKCFSKLIPTPSPSSEIGGLVKMSVVYRSGSFIQFLANSLLCKLNLSHPPPLTWGGESGKHDFYVHFWICHSSSSELIFWETNHQPFFTPNGRMLGEHNFSVQIWILHSISSKKIYIDTSISMRDGLEVNKFSIQNYISHSIPKKKNMCK